MRERLRIPLTIALVLAVYISAAATASAADGKPQLEPPIGYPDAVAVYADDGSVSGWVVVRDGEPEPWQSDPAALREAAAKLKETEDGELYAVLPDGTHVEMSVSAAGGGGASPESTCTESRSAYKPTFYYDWVRGVTSYYRSSGCTGYKWAWGELQYGHWHKAVGFSKKIYAGMYDDILMLSCLYGGNRDWRTEAQMNYNTVYSSTANITITGC